MIGIAHHGRRSLRLIVTNRPAVRSSNTLVPKPEIRSPRPSTNAFWVGVNVSEIIRSQSEGRPRSVFVPKFDNGVSRLGLVSGEISQALIAPIRNIHELLRLEFSAEQARRSAPQCSVHHCRRRKCDRQTIRSAALTPDGSREWLGLRTGLGFARSVPKSISSLAPIAGSRPDI